MEKILVVAIFCIFLTNWIHICDGKRSSLKLLQDQLRVMRESHALDLQVVQNEIDTLRDKLAEITDMNDTDASKGHSVQLKVGRNVQTTEAKLMIDRYESLMNSSRANFRNASVRLKKGFKSFKSWHILSLREIEGNVQRFEDSLERIRQEFLADLDKLRAEIAEISQDLIQEKKKSMKLGEEFRHQMLRIRHDVEGKCMSEIHSRGVSTQTKIDHLQHEIDIIKEGKPTYSIMKDEWQVVFRAKSGNGARFYDAWMSGRNTTSLPSEEENYDFGNDHYRNPIVDSWNSLAVQFVRVALYDRQGKEVAFLLFDGLRSDKANWFAKQRILDSSWSQLRYDSQLNHFSISGEANIHRRFFINVRYGGCNNDHGFMLVVDRGPDACNYEKLPNQPVILYSEFPGGTRWSSMQFGRADHMIVTIKTA